MIISVIVFIAYVAYIWLRYGVHNSISESYRTLGVFEKVLFIAFCWGISIPAMVRIYNVFGTTWQSTILFFGALLIAFIGASPMFWKSDQINRVHLLGSYGGIGLLLIGLVVQGIYYPAFLFAASTAILYAISKQGKLDIEPKNKKEKVKNSLTWWVEVAAFVTIILGLWLQ